MSELESRKARELKLIQKAWSDPAFKAAIFSGNAKDLIAKEAGVMFPAGMTVRVIEEKTGEMVFVLPSAHSTTKLTGSLSDAELEDVAGGKGETTNNNKCNIQTGGAGQNTQVTVNVE